MWVILIGYLTPQLQSNQIANTLLYINCLIISFPQTEKYIWISTECYFFMISKTAESTNGYTVMIICNDNAQIHKHGWMEKCAVMCVSIITFAFTRKENYWLFLIFQMLFSN